MPDEQLKETTSIKPMGESFIIKLSPGDEVGFALNGKEIKKYITGVWTDVRVYISPSKQQ